MDASAKSGRNPRVRTRVLGAPYTERARISGGPLPNGIAGAIHGPCPSGPRLRRGPNSFLTNLSNPVEADGLAGFGGCTVAEAGVASL
jgi:hypothetical protein